MLLLLLCQVIVTAWYKGTQCFLIKVLYVIFHLLYASFCLNLNSCLLKTQE